MGFVNTGGGSGKSGGNTTPDSKTLFIPAGLVYAPPVRVDRNRTFNYLYIDCCDSSGAPQKPTSLTVSIYINGANVYTSPEITVAETFAALNLNVTTGDVIRVVASNTDGLTGGISASVKMVNR